MVTAAEVVRILIGSELSGNIETAYVLSYAVPNKLLGANHGGNSSGFSFGAVQLDIAHNKNARACFTEILETARNEGALSAQDFNRFLRYVGTARPDLKAEFAQVYRGDRSVLNDKVFSQPWARAIIDRHVEAYVSDSLLGSVNDFLIAIRDRWGDVTVFNSSHLDYHTAVAAMTSISNRTGGLGGSTNHFLQIHPKSLQTVRDRYESILGDHWFLVEIGGRLFRDGID